MGRHPLNGAAPFRFYPNEVAALQKALDEESNGKTPHRSACESLAHKFSNSLERIGQNPIKYKQEYDPWKSQGRDGIGQVIAWFYNRRHAQRRNEEEAKAAGSSGKALLATDFEAMSAKDSAWYDVAAFIKETCNEKGELHWLVRFEGFGEEEDEWVKVASAVRRRSLPCEATECGVVLPGDLILCFKEVDEEDLYFDADVLGVDRRVHDSRECLCRFWIRYRHDQIEEVVPLKKICRRPETTPRLQQAREANALVGTSSKENVAVDAATGPHNASPNTSAAPQNVPPPGNAPSTPIVPAQPSAASNATPFHIQFSPGTAILVSPGCVVVATPGAKILVSAGIIQVGELQAPALEPIQPIPIARNPGTTRDQQFPAVAPNSASTQPLSGLSQGVVTPEGPPIGPIDGQIVAIQQQLLAVIESGMVHEVSGSSGPAQQKMSPNIVGVERVVGIGNPNGHVEQQTVSKIEVGERCTICNKSIQPMEKENAEPCVSRPIQEQINLNVEAAETRNQA